MSIIKVTTLVYFVALFIIPSEEKCTDDKGCTQTKTHGMWSGDCYNQNLRAVPQCLRSDLEIIDLSYNRIRKITKEDLSKYQKLKMLYLSDNLLTNIENSTFEESNNLMVLDLSLNAVIHLPPVVLQLPSLKRLYLSQNQNINIIEVVEKTKQIRSPLESLDISFNELDTLPQFGVLPTLVLYNISGNNLQNMSVRDVAGFCNLKKLSNTNFSARFPIPCDCWNIQRWLQEREVQFTKIPCDLREEGCPYVISDEVMEIYNECKSLIAEIHRKSSLLKIGIIVGVVVLVLVLLIIGYILYRRRKHRNAKLSKQNQVNAILNDKKENAGLL